MKRSIIKIALLSVLILGFKNAAFTQAKRPTLMVMPSDAWCNQHGYMLTYNNQGSVEKRADYTRAFQENTDLIAVVSKINELMAKQGFPLKNLESVMKTVKTKDAEDNLTQSKTGSGITESALDKIKKTAKADIILQLTFEVLTDGPKKSIRFTLQGIDSYTDKEVVSAGGTGNPSFSAEPATLMEEAVNDKMPVFIDNLDKYFKGLIADGREIMITVKKFDSWTGDLEKDYGGKELGVNIEDWMRAHTVKGRFNTGEATENMMIFEQVRIPLFDASGNAIDARGFTRQLQSFLSGAPYNITNKLMTRGLGEAIIVLGEK